MDKTNFLLACSGVVPLLALTILVEMHMFEPKGVLSTRLLRILLGLLCVTFALAAAAEIISLKGLEHGGIVSEWRINVIWTAIGFEGGLLLSGLINRVIDIAKPPPEQP